MANVNMQLVGGPRDGTVVSVPEPVVLRNHGYRFPLLPPPITTTETPHVFGISSEDYDLKRRVNGEFFLLYKGTHRG